MQMIPRDASEYVAYIRYFSSRLAGLQRDQLDMQLDELRIAIDQRPVYIMFEQKLNCDPMTDHEIPKSVLPLFEENFAEERQKNKENRASLIDEQLYAFCNELISQEMVKRAAIELESQRYGGEIATLTGLLQVHEKNLGKLEQQVARLSKSLEQLTYTAKEQAHYKGVIGRMYQADGEHGKQAQQDEQESLLATSGMRNIFDLYQRYVSSQQALESSKVNANKLLEQVRLLQYQIADSYETYRLLKNTQAINVELEARMRECSEALARALQDASAKEDEIQRLRLVQEQLNAMVNEANALNPDKVRKQIEEGVREYFAAEVRTMRETIVKLTKDNQQLIGDKTDVMKQLAKANEQIQDQIQEINEIDKEMTKTSACLAESEKNLKQLYLENYALKYQVTTSGYYIVNLNAYIAASVSAGDKAAQNMITYLYKQIYILNAYNADVQQKLKARDRDLKQLQGKSAGGMRAVMQASPVARSPMREPVPERPILDVTNSEPAIKQVEVADKAVQTVKCVSDGDVETKRQSEFDIHCYEMNQSLRVSNAQSYTEQVGSLYAHSTPRVCEEVIPENNAYAVDDGFPQQFPFLYNVANERVDSLPKAEANVQPISEPLVYVQEEQRVLIVAQNSDDKLLRENDQLKYVISRYNDAIAALKAQIELLQQSAARQIDAVPASEIPRDTRVQQYLEFESSLKADLKVNQNYLETQLNALKEAYETVFNLQSNLNIPYQQRQELYERVAKIQHNLPLIEGLISTGDDNAHTAYVLQSVTQSSAVYNKLRTIEENALDPDGKRQVNRQLQKQTTIQHKPTRSNLTELSMISTTHERLFKMAAMIQQRIQESREQYNKEREAGYKRYLESMRCLSREEMDNLRTQRSSCDAQRKSASADEQTSENTLMPDVRSMLYQMGNTQREIQLSVVDLQPYELLSDSYFVYRPEKVVVPPGFSQEDFRATSLPALRITQTAGGERRILTRVSLFGSDLERSEFLGPQRRLDYLEQRK